MLKEAVTNGKRFTLDSRAEEVGQSVEAINLYSLPLARVVQHQKRHRAHSCEKVEKMFESKTPFESKTFKRAYLIGSVIVWVGILIGTAVILSGTQYFAQILPILFVGVIWFIVLLPSAYFWTRPKSDQPSPTK